MDLATIILGIALINVAVFLAGCALAVVRTFEGRHAAGGRPSGTMTYPRSGHERQLGHVGRRAH